MPYIKTASVFLVCLFIFLDPSLGHAADYAYEIHNPSSAPANPNLAFTATNVILKHEADFVYWHPTNAGNPHYIQFKFSFDQEIDTAYLLARSDTFNWGFQAYTKIEASKDGSNWITLKETGPPATLDGWNSGTFAGDLGTELLGGQDLYIRISLNVYSNGVDRNSYYAQALRHQPSINNRTFALEVDFKQKMAAGISPAVLNLLLDDDDTRAARTEGIDPVAIGGEGTKIVYRDTVYTGPTNIAPGSLVGIEKDGQPYLYHPAMGTGVTFSEATNKRAVLYALLDPTGSLTKDKTALEARPLGAPVDFTTTSTKDVTIPSGIRVTTEGHANEIKLENLIQRWCAIKVTYFGGDTDVHYLSPADPIFPDSAQLLRYAVRDTTDYYYTGSDMTLNVFNVDYIEVFAAHARGIALIAMTEWPPNLAKANAADHSLLHKVCLLDLFATMYVQICNGVKAVIPLECLDGVFDMLSAVVQSNLLRYATYDVRLEEAVYHETNSSVLPQLGNCALEFKTAMGAAIFFTAWDILKALGDFAENVPYAMYNQATADTYSKIEFRDARSITVTSPPDKTTYVVNELLDLRGSVIAIEYEDTTPTRHFIFDYFDSLGVVSTPPHSHLLDMDDTHFDLTIPAMDIRYLEYDDEYLLSLGRIYDTEFSHRQAITVNATAGVFPCGSGGGTISNTITIQDWTITFSDNYKMCTETRPDPASLSGELVMLYFFKSDGSGTYRVPWLGDSTYNWATLTGYTTDNPTISVSPLPDYNSSTVKYYSPEVNFGFKVVNYDTVQDYNDGDFLWLNETNAGRVIVNTEWLESDGEYTGNY